LTDERGRLSAVTTFLKHLERGKIYCTLQSHRDEAIIVMVTVPGERWEVEFLVDGSVEVERFVSERAIYGEVMLNELLTQTGQATAFGGETRIGSAVPSCIKMESRTSLQRTATFTSKESPMREWQSQSHV
jgi:hypothetical protein